MKMKIAALSVMLLASVSTAALAQDGRRERGGRGGGERSQGMGERGPRSTVPAYREARPAPVAPQAREPRQAPVAPQASGEGRPGGQRWEGRAEGRRGGELQAGRRGRWTDNDGDGQVRTPADQIDREDRNEAREWRRYNNGQTLRDAGQAGRQWSDGQRGDGRRDGYDRRDNDRRDGDRRDNDRRWDGRRDGDRRWDGRGPRGDHPRWERNRYPHSYQSQRRFRLGAYYPPSGFSLQLWNYGDYLPRAWYSDNYRLTDWWNYDLPMPPPGFDWVRVGPDALLIDTFTGEVVQVVRYLFW